MMPFIQRVTQPVEPGQARLGAAQRGPEQRPHALDRQRRDVEVGGHRPRGRCRPSRRRCARRRTSMPSTGAAQPQVDAERAQVRDPRVDPGLVRRPVEHAVGAAAGAREVEQQLQQDQAAGARADLRARAATSVRVSPSARNFRYAAERRSAPTKSHQLCCSHCSKRRSSQLVSSVSSRSTNSALLLRRDAEPVVDLDQEAADAARSSSDSGACTAPTSSLPPPACGDHHPRRRRRGASKTPCRRRPGSAASCPAGGGRSPGRTESRARRADRLARQPPSPAPASCAPCRRSRLALEHDDRRSRARPARARRSGRPPRRPAPPPSSCADAIPSGRARPPRLARAGRRCGGAAGRDRRVRRLHDGDEPVVVAHADRAHSGERARPVRRQPGAAACATARGRSSPRCRSIPGDAEWLARDTTSPDVPPHRAPEPHRAAGRRVSGPDRGWCSAPPRRCTHRGVPSRSSRPPTCTRGCAGIPISQSARADRSSSPASRAIKFTRRVSGSGDRRRLAGELASA